MKNSIKKSTITQTGINLFSKLVLSNIEEIKGGDDSQSIIIIDDVTEY